VVVILKGGNMEIRHKWNDPRYVGEVVIGDEIYYKGDMANRAGWGIVVNVVPCNHYHKTITIELDDGRIHKINPYMLGGQTDPGKPIYNQGGLSKHVMKYKKEWEVA
jgi:hypothetical protein